MPFIHAHLCDWSLFPLLSLRNGWGISATAKSTAGTDFLESCVGQSVPVPEFRRIQETMPLQLFHSQKSQDHKGPNKVREEGGWTTDMFNSQKLLLLQYSLCWCTVIVNKSVLIVSFARCFKWDFLTQILQRFLAVMLVIHLVWILLMNKVLTVKKDQHTCNVQPDLPCIVFRHGENWLQNWRLF
jgi:hypothetical protein